MSTRNTILLGGEYRRAENRAVAAITPGHLVELTSTDKVQKQSTEGGFVERMFALEDAFQGNTTDDNYAALDLVRLAVVQPGAEVNAFLAANENVAIGEQLIAGGDGTLIANGSEGSATTVKQIVAVALEALDLSSSTAVATRLKVRVL